MIYTFTDIFPFPFFGLDDVCFSNLATDRWMKKAVAECTADRDGRTKAPSFLHNGFGQHIRELVWKAECNEIAITVLFGTHHEPLYHVCVIWPEISTRDVAKLVL